MRSVFLAGRRCACLAVAAVVFSSFFHPATVLAQGGPGGGGVQGPIGGVTDGDPVGFDGTSGRRIKAITAVVDTGPVADCVTATHVQLQDGSCIDPATQAELDTHSGLSGAHHTLFSPNADPGVNHSSYVAGHGNGANCAAGNSPLGNDAAGAAEGCFDVETNTEATAHEGNASAHHTATVDTGPVADCVTATHVQLKNGTCVDPATQAELDTHAGLASVHHAATVNTDAESKCVGTNVLEGSGACVANTGGGFTPNADPGVDHSGLSGGAGILEVAGVISTASAEAGFLNNGGVTSLTCGAAATGKSQVLDDGTLEACDGQTTSVLRQYFPGAHFSPNADPAVDHSSYVAGHSNGADCSAGLLAAGVDGAGVSTGCVDPVLETEIAARVPANETDAAHDTCAEITGCVVGALTAEVDPAACGNSACTVGADDSVADAALSAAVSLLGQTIEGSEVTDSTLGRADIDEALLSIETHATDCTLLTCDAASDGEPCADQDNGDLWICNGSGTPAWSGPYRKNAILAAEVPANETDAAHDTCAEITNCTPNAIIGSGVPANETDAAHDTAVEIANTPAGAIAATNVQAAIDELDTEKQAALTTGSLSATSPVAVSGARTVIGGAAVISIADAAADGATKGAASFTAADFNSSAGNVSIDYTNGQAASGAAKGFLASADWTTFNNKQATTTAGRSLTKTGVDTAADAELYTDVYPIAIQDPATTHSGMVQVIPPTAITITQVDCSTDVGTATIQFDERVLTTPNTVGTDVMTSTLVCDTNNQQTAVFTNATIAAGAILNLDIDAVATAPKVVRINVRYTKDD